MARRKLYHLWGYGNSGTTFMVNNVAVSLAAKGVDVAILDTAQDKTMYYIYTKNEEALKEIAENCMENLSNDICEGIEAENGISVYTRVDDNTFINNVEKILETLLKNHTLILIDCDVTTPPKYFKYAQEVYIVQSMDTYNIPNLTAFLDKLEHDRFLDNRKIKIIINKFVDIKGITEKEIISNLAYYNDPATLYMKAVLHTERVEYMVVPFYESVYEKYIEMVTESDIKFDEYPLEFIKIINELSNEIFPMTKSEEEEE